MHRDLDLVQRILRDQVSDDFTAIRMDNEVEYERICRVRQPLPARAGQAGQALHRGPAASSKSSACSAEIDKAVVRASG